MPEKECAADPCSSATTRADGPAAVAPQLAGGDLWGPTEHPGAAQLRGLQMPLPSRLVHAGLLGANPTACRGALGRPVALIFIYSGWEAPGAGIFEIFYFQ